MQGNNTPISEQKKEISTESKQNDAPDVFNDNENEPYQFGDVSKSVYRKMINTVTNYKFGREESDAMMESENERITKISDEAQKSLEGDESTKMLIENFAELQTISDPQLQALSAIIVKV